VSSITKAAAAVRAGQRNAAAQRGGVIGTSWLWMRGSAPCGQGLHGTRGFASKAGHEG
jgi:hypothetical protein